MPAHLAVKHLYKRQAPPAAPTGAGISDVLTTIGTAEASGVATLDSNPTATGLGPSPVAPEIGSVTPATAQATSVAPSTPTSAASSSGTASSSSSQIPLGTVIGACIGAFAALIFVVVFAVWCNRRISRNAKSRRANRGLASPLSDTRNANGEDDRRRSRLEPWEKLGEGDDTWEGMHQAQTKEIDNGAMERLTMFKKSPSLRSGEKDHTSDSHEVDLGEPAPFAKYHPKLAEELAQTPQRQFLGRLDTDNPISWDGETVGDDSFLSLRNSHMNSATSSGSMSPTMAVVRNTPPATANQLHLWESAEVMHYEGESAASSQEVPNSFVDAPVQKRKSNNPFFNAQDPAQAKRSRNPFTDANAAPMSAAQPESSHASNISTGSNDRAIQSLLAALDVSPEQVHERTSVQPSFVSRSSAITEEVDIATSFPLPPTGSHQAS